MLQPLKRFAWLGGLALSVQYSFAFTPLGPANEPWQDPTIGLNLGGDLGSAPKFYTEEYRRNTPVLYYSFDASWLEYFGTNGVKAVEEAIAVFNSLTNASALSLADYPTAATRQNYRAQALFLLDVKSIIMRLLIQNLGLGAPERFTWVLHNRFDRGPAGCPVTMEYLVVKRNYDPVPGPLDRLLPSSYVNGTLYTYLIEEHCTTPPAWLADAIEYPVDPLDFTYSAVASTVVPNFYSLNTLLSVQGSFYTGLTRDDAAGLRYLLRKDNLNWESPGSTTVSIITNNVPQLLTTSNLTEFAAQALTNAPGVLQGLYPNLVISFSSNYFQTVWVTNVITYLTNFPYQSPGDPPQQVSVTNRVLTIQSLWAHTFDNLFGVVFRNGAWTTVPITNLNAFKANAPYSIDTLSVTRYSPFAPAGSVVLVTNLTSKTYITNQVEGEYFIAPSNACEVVILSSLLTITNLSTNILSVVTNVVTITNASTATSTNFTTSTTQILVDYSTTHVFLSLPVLCVQTNIALAQGIERIRFERRDYDSLIGRFFTPITNRYSLNIVTNYTLMPMRVYRPVTAPDIVFSAIDSLTPGPGADYTTQFFTDAATINFNTNGLAFYPNGAAGPGTIEGPNTFALNKGGPVYFNADPNAYFWWSAEASQAPLLIWGSFDGTTNPPVIYPNGASLQDIEDALFTRIVPGGLPDGSITQPYPEVTFAASGDSTQATWALAPDSPGLPPGLTLSEEGRLSGKPTQRAIFDFVIRRTDATGRFVDCPYSININW